MKNMSNFSTILVYAFTICARLSFTFIYIYLSFSSVQNNTSKYIEKSFETKINDMNSTEMGKKDFPIVGCLEEDNAGIWCSNIH
jgi:hypothetical protein